MPRMRQPAEAMRGLYEAGPQFDPATDPLGIGVQSRGMDSRFQYNIDHPGSSLFGPLPDPRWEGFFQALKEAGVENLVGPEDKPGESHQLRGTPTSFGAGGEEYGPRYTRYGNIGHGIAGDPTSTFNTNPTFPQAPQPQTYRPTLQQAQQAAQQQIRNPYKPKQSAPLTGLHSAMSM